MDPRESTRRNALEMAIKATPHGARPGDLTNMAGAFERFMLGQPEQTFTAGQLTANVLKAAGLTNLSDLQAVLDAVEAALVVKADAEPYRLAANRATAAVLVDLARERDRQVAQGWTAEHDDGHDRGEMAVEAAWAMLPHGPLRRDIPAVGWIMRGGDRRAELVQAIALAVAEVERLDRLPLAPPPTYGDAVAAMRSDSLTRNSCAPRAIVVPCAA